MPRKRRRRSWGSIRSVSRDVHVLRWWANTEAGRTRQCMTFRGSRAEAELMMDRLHVEHADRGDRPVPTVGLAYAMWYEPWLARRLANGKIKPSTHRLYTGCWVKHIQPRWGERTGNQRRASCVSDVAAHSQRVHGEDSRAHHATPAGLRCAV